jgi:F-type H+-transporting ATPase subunit a
MPLGHWITALLNKLLGAPVAVFLSALGIKPEDPHHPIPEYLATELLIFGLAVVFFLWLRRRLSVDRPGGVQQCMEAVLTNPMGVGVKDLCHDIIGHGSERYLPMLGSIGMFVLMCNMISLVPGFESPTAFSVVPLGCAVAVFLYYNWCGIRKHGPLGYGKLFLGPVLPLAPVMLPIEIVSNLARLLSLTVRLWVNMLVSELLYALFFGLTLGLYLAAGKISAALQVAVVVPLLAPMIFILLHIFVGVLQAFVFTLLPMIYVGGAVAEEH